MVVELVTMPESWTSSGGDGVEYSEDSEDSEAVRDVTMWLISEAWDGGRG